MEAALRHDLDPRDLASHADAVRALARRMLTDASAADDVVQDACVAALTQPPAGGPSRAWLVGVVRNLVRRRFRDASRRERRERAAARSESVTPSVHAAECVEVHHRLVASVRALDDPYRTAIVLRYFEGLAVQEIARRHGVPAGTVSTWIHRGLALLRQRLKGHRDDWRAALLPLLPPDERPTSPPVLPVAGAITMSAKVWVAAGLAAVVLVAIVSSGSPAGRVSRSEGRPSIADVDAPPARGVREPAEVRQASSAVAPIAPDPADCALVVETRTLRNEPIAGASVEARCRAPERVLRLSTDADGVARFALTAGSWDIVASAEGFADAVASAAVPRGALRRTTLYLDRGHELRGVVRDASGSAVPFGVVEAALRSARRATADATGAYVLRGLPSGEIQLRAGRASGALAHADLVSIPEVARFDVSIADLPTCTVTGTVVDDATGSPIEGAVVACALSREPSSRTSADGRFRIEGFSAPLIELLTIAAPGYRRFPAGRTLGTPAGAREVDVGVLRAQHGSTLEGVVRASEGPIAGARVTITSPSRLTGSERRETTTDAEGRFSMGSLEAGSTRIDVVADGFVAGRTRETWRMLEVPETGFVRTEFVLTRGAVVAGRVIDDSGEGVAGAHVLLGGVHVTTEADGAFVCNGIVPGASVAVSVRFDGHAQMESTLAVGPGGTRGVVLRLGPTPLVRGRLLAADGRAIRDARIFVVAGRRRGAPSRFAASEVVNGPYPVLADGSFEGPVPETGSGEFAVVAWSSSHAPARTEPIARVAGQGEYRAEVRLVAGASIGGRVTADGRPVAGARVVLGAAGSGYGPPPVRAVTDEGGRFTIEHVALPDGATVPATVSLAGFADGAVDLTAGASHEIVLERPLAIEGTVQTAGRVPATGVHVAAHAAGAADAMVPAAIAFTDAGGRFRLAKLRPGSYRLVATLPGRAVVRLEEPVPAGTADVVLTVP